jgi:hypothetical protein
MLLVLPFSFLDSGVISSNAASDFAPLGIGVELFFNQLISLALVFYVLGLVNLTGLLKNMWAHPALSPPPHIPARSTPSPIPNLYTSTAHTHGCPQPHSKTHTTH